MKTTTKKILLILPLILPILFLSGCEDADWDLLEIAFESWAEENNLYEDGQWQPEGVVVKAVEKTIGSINNQKEFVELDGLNVIRDIEEADALASEALIYRDREQMNAAVALRPNDWQLHEQSGILWYDDSTRLAADLFNRSDEILKEQVSQKEQSRQYDACIKLRTEQLEYREKLISENLEICENTTGCNPNFMMNRAESTLLNLFHIQETGENFFCEEYK